MLMVGMNETEINFELVGERENRKETKNERRGKARASEGKRERKTMTERVQNVLLKKKREKRAIHSYESRKIVM